jgi:hypothetical protein
VLKDGSEVFVALWYHGAGAGQLYMDLTFTSDDPRVVGPIADEIMEVFERHRMPFGEESRREVEWIENGGGIERDHWDRVTAYELGEAAKIDSLADVRERGVGE